MGLVSKKYFDLKIRQLFSNSSVKPLVKLLAVGSNNVIVVLVNLGTAMLLARMLIVDEYGKLLYFYGWANTLRVLLGLGLGTKISKDISENLDTPEKLHRHLSSLLAMRLSTIFFSGILCLFIVSLGVRIEYLLLSWLVASLAVLADFTIAVQGGFQLFYGLNAVLLSQPLSFLALIVVFIIVASGNLLEKTIWSYILSTGFSLLLGALLLARTKKVKIHITLISWKHLYQSLSFISSVFLLTLLRSYYRVFVTLILGMQAQFDLASFASIPLTLILLPASIISVGIVNIIYPELCRFSAPEQRPQYIQSLEAYFRFLGVGGLTYLLVLLVMPAEIISLVYSSKYTASACMVYFLAPTTLFDLWGTLLMFALIAKGRTRAALIATIFQSLALVGGIFLAVNLKLNLDQYLVWIGCAYSLSSLIGLGWMWYALRREVGFILNFRNIIKSTWMFLLTFVVLIAIKYLLHPSVYAILIVTTLGTLIILGVVFRTGFFTGTLPWFFSVHE